MWVYFNYVLAKSLRPARAAKLFFFQKNSQLPKRIKSFTARHAKQSYLRPNAPKMKYAIF